MAGTGTAARPKANGAPKRASAAALAKLERETATGASADEQAASLAKLKADAEEIAVRELQAAAEGLTPVNSVELKGERFKVAAEVGGMAVMKFAAVADAGISTLDFRALAAMYAMLRDCIDQGTPPCGECEECLTQPGVPDPACPDYDGGEWGRFEAHALVTKATADELFAVVQEAMQVITARPTRQP